MNFILTEYASGCFTIILNRPEKNNAFNDLLLQELDKALDLAYKNPKLRVIVLKAKGNNFSAGADLEWMQKMANFSEEENFKDAKIFADILYKFNNSPVPTVGIVEGAVFGGGVGLVAICDVVFAEENASFCFSEVKLGLIPAVISPYVIATIGSKAAALLFMSAQVFNATKAKELNLVSEIYPKALLLEKANSFVNELIKLAPEAVRESKLLVKNVKALSLDENLIKYTASLIAKKRSSKEGRYGIKAFLTKTKPNWDNILE